MKETCDSLATLVASHIISVEEARAILATKDAEVAATLHSNCTLLNFRVPHGSTPVVLSTTLLPKVGTLGYTFFVRTVALNGNGVTPTLTLTLKGAGEGGSDLTTSIQAGMGECFLASTAMAGPASEISVIPNATSDLQIIGVTVKS